MIFQGSRYSLLALVMASMASVAAPASSAPASGATLHTELNRIASKRIYFAHQSVGGNLLDGMRQLAAISNFPLRIQEYPAADAVAAQTLGHTRIGENGNPMNKLQAFAKAFGTSPSSVDIALMKFCYVDFTSETNVKALFSSYRSTMNEIKVRNPSLTIVHVTVPLTVVQTGIKGSLKRLFGMAPYGVLENARREEYNALLRQTYQGREPLFDLARIESTAPDETTTTAEWNGASIPALTPAYTDDGSHLNVRGKSYAARQLLSTLAHIP